MPIHRGDAMKAARLAVVLVSAVLATTVFAAKIQVDAQYDKTFDFARVHTYAWHPQGAGDVKVLEATDDNPAALKARLEPIIVPAVEQNLARRGFTKTTGTPDLHLSYYVLVGPNINSQTMGQFLRPVPMWGLPPFAPATQSLEIYEQGSLILDIALASADSMIWRGSARAEIDRQKSDAARTQRIQDGVAEMLKKFPPRK
jgi:Domain of unknown function (DUF4136)